MPKDVIETPQFPIVSQDKSDEQDTKLNSIGDLYVLGELWIVMLKSGLLGTKWSKSFVPVLKAGPTVDPPPQLPSQEPTEYPAKMRYQDLPLYNRPHFKHEDSSDKMCICPEASEKLMQKYLFPHVKSFRLWIQENFSDFTYELNCLKKEAITSFGASSEEFVKYMRDPENLHVRQPVVAFGGLTGFYLGRTMPQRLLFSGAGLLATGALCFPKETDVIFREIMHYFWKAGTSLTTCDEAEKEKSCGLPPATPPSTYNPCLDRKDSEPSTADDSDRSFKGDEKKLEN